MVRGKNPLPRTPHIAIDDRVEYRCRPSSWGRKNGSCYPNVWRRVVFSGERGGDLVVGPCRCLFSNVLRSRCILFLHFYPCASTQNLFFLGDIYVGTMKKNIAVLIIGQIRTTSFGGGSDMGFENTCKQYMLSKEVVENYNVNIFLVTDHIDVNHVSNYFGNHLKKVVQLDYEDKNIVDIEHCKRKYHEYYRYRKENRLLLSKNINPIDVYVYFYYKLYYAYFEMKEYEKQTNTVYDFIMFARLDGHFMRHLFPFFQQLENDSVQIICNWDISVIGKKEIMAYVCTLIFEYGKYNIAQIKYEHAMLNVVTNPSNYYGIMNIMHHWTESPEVQLFERIMEFCMKNHYTNFNQAIQGSGHPPWFGLNPSRHD